MSLPTGSIGMALHLDSSLFYTLSHSFELDHRTLHVMLNDSWWWFIETSSLTGAVPVTQLCLSTKIIAL